MYTCPPSAYNFPASALQLQISLLCAGLPMKRTEGSLQAFRTHRRSAPPHSPPPLPLRWAYAPSLFGIVSFFNLWILLSIFTPVFHFAFSFSLLVFFFFIFSCCLVVCSISACVCVCVLWLSVCVRWARLPLNCPSPFRWIVCSSHWLLDLSLTLWVYTDHWEGVWLFVFLWDTTWRCTEQICFLRLNICFWACVHLILFFPSSV